MPGPSSATLTLDLRLVGAAPSASRVPPRGGRTSARCRPGWRSRARTARCRPRRRAAPRRRRRRRQRAHATPCCAARSAKRSDDVVEQLADVDRLAAQAVLGLVELGQVAERPHQRARRCACCAARSRPGGGPRPRSARVGPAAVERFQAGDGGGQRRAQVVRQVAHALAPEVVGAAQRVPLPPADVEQHLEGAGAAGRTRRWVGAGKGLVGATVSALGEAALRQRRDRLGQRAQRPRHRRR